MQRATPPLFSTKILHLLHHLWNEENDLNLRENSPKRAGATSCRESRKQGKPSILAQQHAAIHDMPMPSIASDREPHRQTLNCHARAFALQLSANERATKIYTVLPREFACACLCWLQLPKSHFEERSEQCERSVITRTPG